MNIVKDYRVRRHWLTFF